MEESAMQHLDVATLDELIAAAVAAPSVHGTRPWSIRLEPATATLELRADAGPALRRGDPVGRALLVSAGACLFNLRVGVAHIGWEPVVRLLPRPGEPSLLATVRLAVRTRSRRPHRPGLYEAIRQRATARPPYIGHRLPPRVVAELTEAAHLEGAELYLPPEEEAARLLRLNAEAERRTAAEAGRSTVEGRAAAIPEKRPAIAVLTTAHDHRTDWLRAGQALEHVLLLATAEGVPASLLHEAVEWPDLRRALRDMRGGRHGEPVHVQMLIRLGYGPAGPAGPRRPARAVPHSGAPGRAPVTARSAGRVKAPEAARTRAARTPAHTEESPS
jgi:nitroreductase